MEYTWNEDNEFVIVENDHGEDAQNWPRIYWVLDSTRLWCENRNDLVGAQDSPRLVIYQVYRG
jgi:hypothetical protein